MLKKLVIVAAIGFVAVAAVKSTKFGSYIRSEINALREEAESNIPPEKEIARLRNEIKLLDKDLMTVATQLAKETVEVRNLKKTADDLQIKQTSDDKLLQNRAEAISRAEAAMKATDKHATELVVFGERKLSIGAAKTELETGVKHYTANQKSLNSMYETIATRERIKESLEKQLETLKNQKNDLAASIDALEADLANLKLQQMENKYQTDDSRLAKIKEDIRTLKTKMEIEQEKLKILPSVLESSASSASGKSVDEIMAPLRSAPKAAAGETKKPTVE